MEIGGPSDLFSARGFIPVYGSGRALDNCNFGTNTVWEGAIEHGQPFIFNKAKPAGRQYVLEATDLHSIKSESYDFVLSAHCIEHSANPLKAITEWFRVLKSQRTLVLVVPHKSITNER